MNKKIIILIIIILIIVSAVLYFRPIEVSKLIEPLNSTNLPKKVETAIFFSAASDKELDVTSQESLEEFLTLIGNIKVRKNIIKPEFYTPVIKETYRLTFFREDNKYHYINIWNSKYMQINNTLYKITGKPNLSRIYDIIILDQEEGTLNEFYYDLIEKE